MSDAPKTPNVAKAGLIMVASLFLSRVLGLVRDMVITGKFGRSDLTDAYFASFQIPDILFYLIAGGALSSAFIPVFTEYIHTDREDEAWHIFSVVITVMSAIVGAFIIFAWVFAEPLVGVMAPGLPAESVPLVAQMSRILVPAQYAFFIGGVMLGTLYARQVFAVPGLAPNIYNIGIIVGALVLSNVVVAGASIGVVGMSWGALAGAFVGNIFIPLLVIRKMGVKFRPSFDLSHPGVKQVMKLMLPVVLGLSLPGVFAVILKAASSVYPAGVMSSVELGNRLMQAPLGVFGQALALAAFPALSLFFAQGKMDMFSDQLSKTVRTVLFLSVPVAVLFVVIPGTIVEAVYMRGEFGPDDVAYTAATLRMFGIGVAAWCLHPILMRAYFSIKKTWPPVILGTVTTAVFGLTSYLLVTRGFGYQSLPLAASCAAILLAIAMLIAVRRSVCEIDLAGIGLTFAKSVAASIVPAVGMWYAAKQMGPLSGLFASFGLLVVLGIAMVVYAWIYYFFAKLLRMPETDTVKRGMAK